MQQKHSHFFFYGFLLLFICLTAPLHAVVGKETHPASNQAVPVWSWAVPLAESPIRTIFCCRSFGKDDIIALSRHIELKTTLITFPENPTEDNMALEELGASLAQDFDVLVFAGIDLRRIPRALFESLLQITDTGKGLVIIENTEAKLPPVYETLVRENFRLEENLPVTRGLGNPLTPEWGKILEFVELNVSQNGSGRLVRITYPTPAAKTHVLLSPLKYPFSAEPEFLDCYYSLIVRSILWSAGRDAKVTINSILAEDTPKPSPEEIPPDFPEEYIEHIRSGLYFQAYQVFRVELNGPLPKGWRVTGQLRSPGRGYTITVPIKREENSYKAMVLAGPGDYFLDAWIKDRKGRVVDWYTEPVSVFGLPEIKRVNLSKEVLQPNDQLNCAVEIKDVPIAQVPTAIYARATDSLGRLVTETYLPSIGETETAVLTLNFADLLSPQVKLEFFALKSTARKPTEWDLIRASHAFRYLPVSLPLPTESLMLVCNTPVLPEYNCQLLLKNLYGQGIRFIYAPYDNYTAFILGKVGLMGMFEVAAYRPQTVLDSAVRVPSFADKDFQQNELNRLVAVVSDADKYGAKCFSLGKGNCLSQAQENVCQSKDSLDEFRKDLQDVYRHLDNLNRIWGTQYKAWNEVMPPPEDVARRFDLPAGWLDFRAFMDKQFKFFHDRASSVVHKVCSDACVGFLTDKSNSPYSGYDWHELISKLDYIGIPPKNPMAKRLRSYATKNQHGVLVIEKSPEEANGKFESFINWYPWYGLTHGAQFLYLGEAFVGPSPGNLFSSNEILSTMMQTTDNVSSHFGPILRAADTYASEVGIYDSKINKNYLYLKQNLSENGDYAESSFVQILQDLSVQFRFITVNELQEQPNTALRFLFLPSTLALSENEINALKAFVDKGGILIGDVLPGIVDEHGILRAENRFREVFQDFSEVESIEEIVRAATSSNAILLGNRLNDYYKVRREMCGKETRKILSDLLRGFNYAQPVTIETSGTPFDGELTIWNYGAALICTVLAAPDGDKDYSKGELRFSRKFPIYDLMTGKRLPSRSRVRLKLSPGFGACFSQLPYEVEEVSVIVPEHVLPGSRLYIHCSIKTLSGAPGNHLVRAELVPFMGKRIGHYDRVIKCKDGVGETYVPLALNEQPGVYLVRVTDLLTGLKTEKRFVIDKVTAN